MNFLKKTLFQFFISVLFICNTYSQNSPQGKTYTKLINSVCKKMEGGGCNVDTYQVMEFSKDKVSIYKLIKASCTPKEREESYNNKPDPVKAIRYWSIKDNKIFIEKYDEYGKMELKNEKIIAKKGNTITEFSEQK